MFLQQGQYSGLNKDRMTRWLNNNQQVLVEDNTIKILKNQAVKNFF